MTDYHKYASHTHTHTCTQFIFHRCVTQQSIGVMLMRPAFDNRWSGCGSGGTSPAVKWRRHYLMWILPEENKQPGVTHRVTACEGVISFHRGGRRRKKNTHAHDDSPFKTTRVGCNFRCSLSMWAHCKVLQPLLLFEVGGAGAPRISLFASHQICYLPHRFFPPRHNFHFWGYSIE